MKERASGGNNYEWWIQLEGEEDREVPECDKCKRR